jgi:hypothetical protein
MGDIIRFPPRLRPVTAVKPMEPMSLEPFEAQQRKIQLGRLQDCLKRINLLLEQITRDISQQH